MKEQVNKIMRTLFFIACVLVTLGGIVLFCTIVYGVVIGGEAGSAAIIFGQKKIVPIYEWIMGGGVFIGLINTYINKSHSYKMESKKK